MVGTSVNIPIEYLSYNFKYCPYTSTQSSGSPNPTLTGFECDLSQMGGLALDPTLKYLSGTLNKVGMYNVQVGGSYPFGSTTSYTISAAMLITIRIIGSSGPQAYQGFYFNPPKAKLFYSYNYTFDLDDFFTISYPIIRVTAEQKVLNSDKVTYNKLPLPSWLIFTDLSLT